MAEVIAKSYGYDLPTSPLGLQEKLILLQSINGTQAALEAYWKAKNGAAPSSEALNALGYFLLSKHRNEDAIHVFQRNVADHPQDANTHDSLAEAYMNAGDRDKAIQNYKISLKMNPKNDNAMEKLKTLRAP